MAEAIGLVASVLGILGITLKDLPDIKAALQGQWREDLERVDRDAEDLKEKLETLSNGGQDFSNRSQYDDVIADLHAVKDNLQKLKKNSRLRNNMSAAFLMKNGRPRRLDEAMKRLADAKRRVQEEATFTLVESRPRWSKEAPELPSNLVGGKRLEKVLELVEQRRRLVITGEGGLGKTTLLQWALRKLRERAGANNWVEAYVHIGTDRDITKFQSSIIRQLDDSKHLELPSLDHGRAEMTNVLSSLKGRKRKVFLALDDVWDAEDLRKLLPSQGNLGSLLPEGSCLIATSRYVDVHNVVEDLWQPPSSGIKRADVYMLPVLEDQEAMKLFKGKAGLEDDAAYEELSRQVVKRCGGMPLALDVVGALFSDPVHRARWEEIVEKWDSLHDQNDEFAEGMEGRIFKVLRTSYDALERPEQEAFRDVVNFFCGRKWSIAESTVGEKHMRKLERACLIRRVTMRHSWKYRQEVVLVWAHDLIVQLGRNLAGERAIRMDGDPTEQMLLLDGDNTNTIEIIRLDCWLGGPQSISQRDYQHRHVAHKVFHNDMRSLRVLQLHVVTSFDCPSPNNMPSLRHLHLKRASLVTGWNISACKQLTVLILSSCRGVTLTLDEGTFEFPRCLRRLHLERCQGWACLPQSLGRCRDLQVLKIKYCNDMQSLPAGVISRLTNLRELVVKSCNSMIGFSIFNGLSSLQILNLSQCTGLIGLPDTIFNGLSSLHSLSLSECTGLSALPDTIFNGLSSLHELDLSKCTGMSRLPDNIFSSLSSLHVLHLSQCTGLIGLPDTIFNGLSSLHEIHLSGCTDLIGLPNTIFNSLSSLHELDLSQCTGLSALPDTIFNGLSSLETLLLFRCTGLIGLPDTIFNGLSSLHVLYLSQCTGLIGLPDTIFNGLSSLHELHLSGCTGLIGLPNTIFNSLSSLHELDLSQCTSLSALPDTIFYGLSSLHELHLSGCTGLIGLPNTIFSSLSSLQILNLSQCTSLSALPDTIFNGLSSLRLLHLSECTGLIDLPDTIFNGLSSLCLLRLSGCTGLIGLPDTIFSGLSSEIIIKRPLP